MVSATFKEKVETVQSLLACVAILAGGCWGVNEYLEKKKQDRIGKSFEIVNEFRVNKEFIRYGEFVEKKAITRILHNRTLKGTEKAEKITKLHSDQERKDLKRVIELYENAAICALVNHCDKNVIAEFMARDAHSIYVYGSGVIKELRQSRNDPSYADELAQIREWYCDLPPNHKRKSVSWCK